MRTRPLGALAALFWLALLVPGAMADSPEPDRRTEIAWSAAGSGPSPVLMLPTHRAVTVSFVDAAGEPWPVSDLAVPTTTLWLTARRAKAHPHVAILTGAETAADGAGSANLVALLDGLATPVHLTLEPGPAGSATAVTVRIAERLGDDALADGSAVSRGAAFEAAVRDYLLANPGVLREALDPSRQLAARVAERRDELLAAAGVPALGDASGAVTVVEFFDYRCGYCKRSLEAVRGALLQAGVRVQMREYPILGEESVYAARAALAAARQGAYEAAHFALMEHGGAFDDASIGSIMRELGLDVERLLADMASDEIAGLIEANRELAARLGVTGTPAFLVLGPGGVEVSPGALDAERLAAMIDAAG